MQKEDLREVFNQPYNREAWLKTIENTFNNVSIFSSPKALSVLNKKIASFVQLGTIRLTDGKVLALFEVRLAENINLVKNRVDLRNIVNNYIDQEQAHGVLSIYEQGGNDYRFTFAAKSTEFDEEGGEFVNIETDKKRYTYVLGKNESCKTAINRFWELSNQKGKATIKDVENAFSVERLNKEFFDKYKNFYEDFVQYLTGKRFIKEQGKWVEKEVSIAQTEHKEVFGSDDKLARNFVKLLLGRLVFIQFLQKKGWMGVPAINKNWENGEKDFLLNFFNSSQNKDQFHSQNLYPLFYNAFNTPKRVNDVFKLTGTRIPYLNGGLFEDDYPNTQKIDFPNKYFEDLLEFFGQYNFTIDENDPFDNEVGIDPEMLGHIFENLLEDNKDRGSFYTPKPIVQYMCQESLIQYLKMYLQNHKIWPEDEEVAKDTEANLQNFVRKKIAEKLLNDYEEPLAKALKEVKICDPAIGSGAFPMGLLNEIFQCVQVLFGPGNDSVKAVWGMEDWAPDMVKKNIIQHSIYGVDIEKGAVDIARLRFWLSLIVDEKEPTPLPNLDFKIMQGNSLIESYEGIDLSKIVTTKTSVTEVAMDLFGNPINLQTSIFDTKYFDDSNITDLIDIYFNTQIPEQKQKQKKEIDSIIHRHIDYNLEFEENKILITITNITSNLGLLKEDKNHSKGIAEKTIKAREKLSKQLADSQKRLEHLQSKRKELHDLQKTAERPYFLWHLYFKDVFDNGGFDIVIGNPPYIQLQKDAGSLGTLYQKSGYKTYEKTGDIYSLFYEKGYNILKDNGHLIYITSNKWMRASYGESTRKFFAENTNPLLLIDFSGQKIFESATVDTNILLFSKEKNEEKTYACLVKEKVLNNLSIFVSQHGNICEFNIAESWVVLSPIEKRIKQKIEQIGTPLKDWDIQINYGIKTGYNDAFIIDGKKKNELIKEDPKSAEIIRPILRGRDIYRYKSDFADLWLINVHNGIREKGVKPVNIKDYPALKKHLDYYYPQLEKRADKGDTPYNLRNCAYMEEFYRQKIVWGNLNLSATYCIAESGMFVNAPCPMIVPANNYLLAVLNSKVADYYIRKLGVTRNGGYFEYKPMFIEQLPVPIISEAEQISFIELVDKLNKMGKNNITEKDIDNLVFKLYDLSEEEIEFITSL